MLSWACTVNKTFIFWLVWIWLIVITRVINQRFTIVWLINLVNIGIIMENLCLTIQSLLVCLLSRIILCFNNWWEALNLKLLLNVMHLCKHLRVLGSECWLLYYFDFLFSCAFCPWKCGPHALSVKSTLSCHLFVNLLSYSPFLFV